MLFPINNDEKVFIYPPSLKQKLPKKVIDIIKPSQKHIPPYHISTLMNAVLTDSITNDQYHYLPFIHLQTIKQLLQQPLSDLHTKNGTLKNHFTSNNTVKSSTDFTLNQYKYGQPIKNIHNQSSDQTKSIYNQTTERCTIEMLRSHEDQYDIKYVIIDKISWYWIIEKPLFKSLIKETTKY